MASTGLRAGLAIAALCAFAGFGLTAAARADDSAMMANDTSMLMDPQPMAEAPLGFGLSEARAGIFAHSVYNGFLPVIPSRWMGFRRRIQDVNVELLFRLPDAQVLEWIGTPRLNLGGTINFGGRESMAHLALTWTVPVFDLPVFVEGSFGGAIHNGILTGPGTKFLRPLGCRVNFYESASLGFNLSDTTDLMLTYEHTSNAGLCPPNAGLSNLGVRLGFKFD